MPLVFVGVKSWLVDDDSAQLVLIQPQRGFVSAVARHRHAFGVIKPPRVGAMPFKPCPQINGLALR